MKSRNTQRIKIADEQKVQFKADNNQAGILIVSGHPSICQRLVTIINQEPDIGSCMKANNTNQTYETISKQEIGLAIVDISFKDTNGFKLADTIKLQCPNLPIILLSRNDSTFNAEHTLQAATKESFANKQATEQIIKAIRYAQSLLRSQIFGFTLVVNLEGSPQNDY
ncbi:MAG: response regulator [Planctomycetota bacterium]|jgi:DNA-binding NarL/FixJ family response regulator